MWQPVFSTRHLVNGYGELLTEAGEARDPLRGFAVLLCGELAEARIMLLHQIEIDVLHLPNVHLEFHIARGGYQCLEHSQQHFVIRVLRQLQREFLERSLERVTDALDVELYLSGLDLLQQVAYALHVQRLARKRTTEVGVQHVFGSSRECLGQRQSEVGHEAHQRRMMPIQLAIRSFRFSKRGLENTVE